MLVIPFVDPLKWGVALWDSSHLSGAYRPFQVFLMLTHISNLPLFCEPQVNRDHSTWGIAFPASPLKYRICSIRHRSRLVAAYNSIGELNKIVAALE